MVAGRGGPLSSVNSPKQWPHLSEKRIGTAKSRERGPFEHGLDGPEEGSDPILRALPDQLVVDLEDERGVKMPRQVPHAEHHPERQVRRAPCITELMASLAVASRPSYRVSSIGSPAASTRCTRRMLDQGRFRQLAGAKPRPRPAPGAAHL
jgi:hypothetical protein